MGGVKLKEAAGEAVFLVEPVFLSEELYPVPKGIESLLQVMVLSEDSEASSE